MVYARFFKDWPVIEHFLLARLLEELISTQNEGLIALYEDIISLKTDETPVNLHIENNTPVSCFHLAKRHPIGQLLLYGHDFWDPHKRDNPGSYELKPFFLWMKIHRNFFSLQPNGLGLSGRPSPSSYTENRMKTSLSV